MTETLWLHAAHPADPVALEDLLAEIGQLRPGLAVIASGDASPPARRTAPGPGVTRLPQKAFLDWHRPNAAVFAGPLDPNLAAQLGRRSIPAVWVDATLPTLRRWPRLSQSAPEVAAQAFRHILSAPGGNAERLSRLPGVGGKLETPGLLLSCKRPLPYSVAERDRLAARLAGRPVWMALAPPAGELAAVLEAHRGAIGQSHRLLLVLAVAPEKGPALAAELPADGWYAARRSAGDDPEPEMQIVVADDPDEMGLWYRLAPIAYLGGTLQGTGARHDPFEAAALGSALIYGPKASPYVAEIQRLANAGAARRIDSPAGLARAVARLLSADAAAGLATAAWDVVTAGAPAMNRALTLIEEMLDGGHGS